MTQEFSSSRDHAHPTSAATPDGAAPKKGDRWWLTGAEKSCTSKRRYPDEYVARAAAQIVCDTGAAKRGAMWIYPCEFCRGWHISNTKSGYARKVTSEHIVPPARPDPPEDLPATPHLGGYWGSGADGWAQ